MRNIPIDVYDLVKRYEGLKLKAYKCPAGIWTIGYGHTKGVKPNDEITNTAAEKLLVQDLEEAAKSVDSLVKVPLTDLQRGVLCSFVFNLGHGRLKESTLLTVLNQKEYDAVPEQLLRWTRSNGKILRGLLSRRLAEALLWIKG